MSQALPQLTSPVNSSELRPQRSNGRVPQSAEQVRTQGGKSHPVDPARLFSIVFTSSAARGQTGGCAGRGPGSSPSVQHPVVASGPGGSHPCARGCPEAKPQASSRGRIGQRPQNSTLRALDGITQQLPSVEPAKQRSDPMNSSLLQLQRHPGAGHLVRSSAVQDHFLAARNLDVSRLHFFGKDSERPRDTLRFPLNFALMAQVHDNDRLAII